MLDERHNESFNWKNKLDELDHLPTEPAVDRDDLWKRLHARLGEKEKHNKAIPAWYWTAAACILVAIGISWLLIYQKAGEPAGEKARALPQRSLNKGMADSGEPRKIDTQHIHVIAQEGKKARVVVVRNVEDARPKLTREEEQNSIPSSPDLSDSLQILGRNTVRSADSVSSHAIAATPNRRRLRVIHINELEMQSEQQIKYSGTALPYPKSKSSGYETIPAFSLSKNASDNIVKIKLSPSN